ncbi:MAG: phosphotransferase [Candidatus Moraniibacteriota bacterium]
MRDQIPLSPPMNKRTPVDRLNYSGDLSPVVDRLCDAYKIGRPVDFSVIETGYEDCNVVIKTSKGKYLAKFFSKVRSQENISRYVSIIKKALEAGVNHPQLMKTNSGDVVYVDNQANGISLVLMEFIEGKNFIQLGRIPSADELGKIIEQASKINSIDYHPAYYFDSWALQNIQSMLERVEQFIQPDDLWLARLAIEPYMKIPIDKLPYCFVHGDLTKANVFRGDDGTIYILDFSVSNWYPRIQELAIITANLLYDKNNYKTIRERSELVLNEYNKLVTLTDEEKEHLYAYALAGVAMDFLGAHQEKFIYGNDTKETDFWLGMGRDGLKKELSNRD